MFAVLKYIRRPALAVLCGLLVISLLVAGTIPLAPSSRAQAAASLEDLERELEQQKSRLENIEGEIQQKQAGLRRARADRNQLVNYLGELETEMNSFRNRIYELQAQLDELVGQLELTRQHLQEAETELDGRVDLAGKRVRALYENGTISTLELLVSSRSFTDFLTRFSYLQQMLKQDVQLLHEVKDEKAQIEAQKAELEVQHEHVAGLRAEATSQLARIASIRDTKQVELAEKEQDIEEITRQLDELEDLSNQIEKQLKATQEKVNAELKARGISFIGLNWPVPKGGWISSSYGPRYHPILKTYKVHTGVDIAIKKGTPIYAAAAGKVTYSGWLGGYGKAVMIAHGTGRDGRSYVTLYAHTSVLRVNAGDWVTQGQRIADVGSTGYSTGPHLHFEVRVDGAHTNPMQFFD